MSGSVAVIGVGAMGAPIASRINRAGFDVLVCDRNAGATAPLVEMGMTTADDPAACATADVVLVLVATAKQVRDVVLGEHGLLSGMTPGQLPVIAVMSTVSAESVIALQADLLPAGVVVLDAPVSGGVLRAEQGTLSVMVGGEATGLESLRPVLEAMASRIFHCGPLGSGATLKIINNAVGTASTLILAEACRIAVERGLDLKEVVSVLDASSGRTYLTADPAELPVFFSRLTERREDFDALMTIIRKDFGLAVDLAGDVDGYYPLIERLKSFADSIGEETYENWKTVGTQRGES